MREAVIITGGARRVGAAMAVYFASKNFDIALHYNNSEDDALALQQKLRSLGVNCELFQQDLRDTAKIPALMADIRAKMPNVVALINNASIFERAEFMETDEALFDRQLAVNFKAPFFLTQAFAKVFGGSVINLLDTDIVTNQTSHFAYLLSKKTLAEFTKMAAKSLGSSVRVNGVCPTIVLPSNELDIDYMNKLEKTLPLQTQISLEEIAEVAYWLTQQKTITGQMIFVDGGKHVL